MTISRRLGRRPVALLLAVCVAAGGSWALSTPASATPAASTTTTPAAGTVTVGYSPSLGTLSPDQKTLYTVRGNELTAVSTTDDTVTHRYTVGLYPGIPLVSSDSRYVYTVTTDEKKSTDLYDYPSVDVVDTQNPSARRVIMLPGRQDVGYATLSPDGTHLVVAAVDEVSLKGTVFIVDLATGGVLRVPEPTIPGDSISRDQKVVITGDSKAAVIEESHSIDAYPYVDQQAIDIVDLDTGVSEHEFAVEPWIEGIAASPDGQHIAVSFGGPEDVAHRYAVDEYDVGSGADVASATLPDDPEVPIYSSDGSHLYSLMEDFGRLTSYPVSSLEVVDTASWTATNVPLDSSFAPEDMKLDPGAHRLIIAGEFRSGWTGSSGVLMIDTGSNSPTTSMDLGTVDARATLFLSDGSRAYYLHGTANPAPTGITVLDLAARSWTTQVSRISGFDPYWQSVAASKAAYPGTAPIVYLAAANSFPDAVGSAAAASSNGGPLLLTSTTGVPAQVLAEIQRLRPKKIVTVGGTSAFGIAVAKSLAKIHLSTVRRTGADRYATARSVLAGSVPASGRTVYVATGAALGAAPAAAAAAASAHDPFLLVNGSATTLDAATRAALTAVHPTGITIVGGTASISSGVASGLATIAPVTRIAGASTSDTARLLDDAAFPSSASAVLATVASQTDDFAAITVAAQAKSPLELLPGAVTSTCIPEPLEDELAAKATSSVTLVGGTASLSTQVAALAPC